MNERIRKLRKHFQLTQQEFADRIGIKRNTIATYESGRNQPIDAVINLICMKFKVNEDWLRHGTGEMFETTTNALDILAKEYNLSDSAYVAVEKFIKLKPDTQMEILNYFTEVVKSLPENLSTTPNYLKTNLSNLSIDERVELYRKELEYEEKVMEKSEVC